MNLYIDESGSINTLDDKLNKYFIIGILIPKDKKKLKRVFKRFISKKINILKEIDKEGKMFDKDGNFIELKGYCLNRELKLDFIKYFCKNDLFSIRYIILNNKEIQKRFTKNKARTFNYLLKLFIKNCFSLKYLNDKSINLHIDERNIKTDSKYSLEDYLNMELNLEENIIDNINVQYYDSSQNIFIQIADVFSNIMYSNLITDGAYEDIILDLKDKKYILKDFIFPSNNKILNKNC